MSRPQPPAPSLPANAPFSSRRATTVVTGPRTIYVNARQQGNPLLLQLKNVFWEFRDNIVPDYVTGQSSCALFLSLKYHRLHPEYIHMRAVALRGQYTARALIVHVDVDDHRVHLRELSVECVKENLTLLLGWTVDDCARYIETIKSLDGRPVDSLKVRTEETHLAQMIAVLTAARGGVNKTDALTLVAAFGSLSEIVRVATSPNAEARLSACPGLGPKKVKRLIAVFQQSFAAIPSSQIRQLTQASSSRQAATQVTSRLDADEDIMVPEDDEDDVDDEM